MDVLVDNPSTGDLAHIDHRHAGEPEYLDTLTTCREMIEP